MNNWKKLGKEIKINFQNDTVFYHKGFYPNRYLNRYFQTNNINYIIISNNNIVNCKINSKQMSFIIHS